MTPLTFLFVCISLLAFSLAICFFGNFVARCHCERPSRSQVASKVISKTIFQFLSMPRPHHPIPPPFFSLVIVLYQLQLSRQIIAFFVLFSPSLFLRRHCFSFFFRNHQNCRDDDDLSCGISDRFLHLPTPPSFLQNVPFFRPPTMFDHL